jgi:DNA-nicking Smr family endonuclease
VIRSDSPASAAGVTEAARERPCFDSSYTRTTSETPDDDAVVIPVGEELDLHPFAPRDVPSVVEEYLLACRARGILELRLVHGRGKGVQVVRSLLARLPFVLEAREAPPASGGWGATFVKLRPHQEK